MCYGFPCGWWNGWTETCSKPRGEICLESVTQETILDEDDPFIPAPPPRMGRLGAKGFWLSCKAHQLTDAIKKLRAKYGESVIYWGRDGFGKGGVTCAPM